MSDIAIELDDPLLQSEFVGELIRQVRARDTYGAREDWSDAKLLDPFILTKERKAELPLVGNPTPATIANIHAYYNALSVLIEKECGHMAFPMISLHDEGFGRVLITVGKLVVVDKTLRDVHRFGFANLSKLKAQGDRLLTQAQALVSAHPAVAAI